MKGQTAIEYLMTYGWAILIILIVAGVLAYYGIFSPSSFLGPTARGFGQIQVLNPWAVSATVDTMTLNLANRVGGAVNITTISATIDDVSGYTCTPVLGDLYIASGDDATFSCTIAPVIPATAEAGDAYTATLVINYRYPSTASTVDFSTAGTITGTYS
ncbi:MAG: hypothetical protein V1818_02470 [Candidatus Aenigmatarchaeota archaeon]